MIDPSTSAHYVGDCRQLLKQLPDACVQTIVTSPPFWGLRDYGHDGQIGLERTPELFVSALVGVFREARRVLRADGTLWLNLGDSYAQGGRGRVGDRCGLDGSRRNQDQSRLAIERRPNGRSLPPGLKKKDLIGLPWMTAFALRADGWYLRSDIIWSKPNASPESVTDRPTRKHEYIFLFSKRPIYFYDASAIGKAPAPSSLRPNRKARPRVNKRSVWEVATSRFAGAHFATFPPKLIEPCILAGSRRGDLVLDLFHGSGTTGAVAEKHGRRWIGFDLGYQHLVADRIAKVAGAR